MPVTPLTAEQLYRRCDQTRFDFDTTVELEVLGQPVGQERARRALEFGARIDAQGYNLYVLGPPGAGRHAMVRRFLEIESAERSSPEDWCYANNFEDPQCPVALRLPTGVAVQLQNDMLQLGEELTVSLPVAFESDDYRGRLAEINEEFEEHAKKDLEDLKARAEQRSVRIMQTPMGFAIAPVKNGESMAQEQFDQLPDQEKEAAQVAIAEVSALLRAHLEQIRKWRRDHREQVKELNRDATLTAVGSVIEEIKSRYQDLPRVLGFLEAVQADVIRRANEFVKPGAETPALPGLQVEPEPLFARYEINVLVHNGDKSGAPVVYESNPTFQNLVGRIEHAQNFGTLVTDFSMIRAGSLHKANGGYLLLDADRLLTQPYAYQGLKRALFNRRICIESLPQVLGWMGTGSLEPEQIPLDVKIVLIGNRWVYHMLQELDPEFNELFKVAADFEDRVDRDEPNSDLYARLIAAIVAEKSLRPLDRSAVARVIEHSARSIGDSEKLSTHQRSLTDLLLESNYWAGYEEADIVSTAHVQQAIDEAIQRLDRIRQVHQEEILRNTLLIDTQGETIGQVNGLAVTGIGGFSFGAPSRITATVRTGGGEIVDIEREIELGGAIHSKGVMILSSFLGSRYGRNVPLSLAASLVFEQTYGGVDGDSASVAELSALLSSIAKVPIRQCLAVTGSVNQHGRVQVIGGVNEKIEGFFDICRSRGLSGEHGVLIPADNVKHLMLRGDVVEACESGKFHVWPIESIDQAVNLLTGLEPGQRGEDGTFAEDSFNRRVEDALEEFAHIRHAFGEKDKSEES